MVASGWTGPLCSYVCKVCKYGVMVCVCVCGYSTQVHVAAVRGGPRLAGPGRLSWSAQAAKGGWNGLAGARAGTGVGARRAAAVGGRRVESW